MKILHVIDSEGVYGAEMMLLNLAQEQKNMGLESAILNMRNSSGAVGSFCTEAAHRGIPFRTVMVGGGADFAGALKVARFGIRGGYDIFHSHGYKSNILLSLIPRKIRAIPLVITVHGWTSGGKIGKLRFYEWLDKVSLKRADAVVAVSTATADLSALRRVKVSIVRNGISKPDFNGIGSDLDAEIIRFCSGGPTVGSIGRLSSEKGYDYLIRALGRLAQNDPNVRLVIIGEGEERRNLEQLMTELGLAGRVLLPGFQSRAYRYLPLFDVFALSSLTEGFPITIIEAMWAGVPIVASDVGGVREAVSNRETGFLVEARDIEALFLALAEVLSDADLQERLGRRARKFAEKRLSSRAMAERYLEVYKVALGKRRVAEQIC